MTHTAKKDDVTMSMQNEDPESRIDLYSASDDVLRQVVARPSVWRERWEKGDGHKGTPVQEWFNANTPGCEMVYKDAMSRQLMWVRDTLRYVLGNVQCEVISTHTSKSITLPVYRITSDYMRLRVYLRDNFYNWKLSVDSKDPVNADFTGLFATSFTGERDYSGDHLDPVYFEGFPENVIFGYYGPSDGRRWSAEVTGREQLWSAIFLIARALGGGLRVESAGRAQHRRALDADTARRLLTERAEKRKKEQERTR